MYFLIFLSPIYSRAIRLSIHKPFGLLFYYFYEGRNLLDDLQVFQQKFCNNYKIGGNLRGGWEERADRKDRKGGKDRLSLIVDLVGPIDLEGPKALKALKVLKALKANDKRLEAVKK